MSPTKESVYCHMAFNLVWVVLNIGNLWWQAGLWPSSDFSKGAVIFSSLALVFLTLGLRYNFITLHHIKRRDEALQKLESRSLQHGN